MVLVAAPRRIELGPLSLSGALTVVVALLIICMLPGYAVKGVEQSLLPGPKVAGTGVPWQIWGFLLLLAMSFFFGVINETLSADSVQNGFVYLSFIGAMAFAAAVDSGLIVLRGWQLMKTFATWAAYLSFVMAVTGLDLLADRPMAMVGVIVLAIVIPGTPTTNWVRFAPFFTVAAMALSLSRTSTAIGLALLAFIVLRGGGGRSGRSGRLTKALFVAGIVLASAYLLVVYYTPFRNRFLVGDNALQVGDVSISTQGRAKLWELLISNSSDGWIFGHGIGSASQLIGEYVPGQSHPHNEYLRLFYDFGAVGLALFVVGYALLIWRSFRSARQSDSPVHWAAFIALSGIALNATTDNPFVYPFVMLPLGSLVGLSLALTRIERSQSWRADRSAIPE